MAKLGGSKQKKMNARVDFTPMVDMIMLLVTFFMLCTTLMKPQSMDITMPSDKEDIKDEQRSQVQTDQAITIIIDENDQIYYFEGKPSTAHLTATTYGRTGIRAVLQHKNAIAMQQVAALKAKYSGMKTSDAQAEKRIQEQYKKDLTAIKNSDVTPTAIIKATDKATYKNLIDVLDEMQICHIGKYVIDKVGDRDNELLDEVKK